MGKDTGNYNSAATGKPQNVKQRTLCQCTVSIKIIYSWNIYVGADSLIYKKILWPLGFPQSDVLQICCMYRFWELKGIKLKEVSFSLLWTGIAIFYNSVIENMKGKRKWKGWRLHRVVQASCKTSREVDDAKTVATHWGPQCLSLRKAVFKPYSPAWHSPDELDCSAHTSG